MVEKRFDIFNAEDYKKVIGRMRELIEASQENKIKEEFGCSTNDVWDSCGNFLSEGDSGTDSLDIIHITSDYCNEDAYLYLMGDVENDKAMLCYLVRNDNCDVFDIGMFSTAEDLVKQLNEEHDALVFFDKLFNKIEQLLEKDDETLLDLNERYSETINTKYFFDNFDLFLEAYLNPNSHYRKVQYIKELIKSLTELVKDD